MIIEEGFEKPGLNHLGWEVDNEAALVAAIERAIAAGCKDYLTIDHTFSHSIYVADADGIFHEFYADVMHDWRTVFKGGPIPNISARWDPAAEAPSAEPKWQRAPDYQRVDGAPVHPLRTTRAVMVVDDVERSLPFYTGFAGPRRHLHGPGRLLRIPAGFGGDARLPLRALCQGRRPGERLPSLLLRDGGRGGGWPMPRLRSPRGRIETAAAVDSATKRSFYLRDPDGFLVEFYATRDCDFAAAAAEPPAQRPFHA